MGYAAVCFDVGNTLLSSDPPPSEIYAEALSRLGRPVTADEVGPVFADAWAEMQRRTAEGEDRYRQAEREWWAAFLDEVLGRLGHDAPPGRLLDDLYAVFADPATWRIYPEVLAVLDELCRRGVALAVVSNWDRRLPALLDALDLTRRFEVVTVSALLGIEKPAPEIFLRTLEQLGGVPPDAAIHVGDSPREDYEGAAGAGLLPVLIDRRGAFRGSTMRRAASLEEIVDLVDGRTTG